MMLGRLLNAGYISQARELAALFEHDSPDLTIVLVRDTRTLNGWGAHAICTVCRHCHCRFVVYAYIKFCTFVRIYMFLAKAQKHVSL